MSTWVIDSGTLHARQEGRTAQSAFLSAVRKHQPRNLGKLVRVRRICCRKRNHAPHFVAFWLDTIAPLRRAGLLAEAAGKGE